MCIFFGNRLIVGFVEDFHIQGEVMNHLLKEAIQSAQHKLISTNNLLIKKKDRKLLLTS